MQPILDKEFIPATLWNRSFLTDAKKDISIAVERENGFIYRYGTKIGVNGSDNRFYIERLVKMLLWAVGGFKLYIDDEDMAGYLNECYSDNGLRAFDKKFMERVYEKPFEVIYTLDVPKTKGNPVAVNKNLSGDRIGFDAGGSDMKISAVRDGEVIFSQEVVWLPKLNADPAYHYEQIKNTIALGIDKLGGKADAIGVSSAGIYIANRTMVASLFIKVPQDQFDEKIKDIYINIAKEFGAPVTVANDGDIAAIAGSICLKQNGVLGVAMGTSEAAGYVDENGNITGWLNELAFAPVDYNTAAICDEWSGDFGVGCKYFSQDAVIKLAPRAGIVLPESMTLAEQLKEVQKLLEEGHNGARQIFETIGVYFGYAVAHYAEIYDINYLQVMGRVISGEGGDIIIEKANAVLAEEFSELAEKITIYIPDEYERRIGQSVAAASL
jgi:predicted NBD/HSP70 family sugar kinase